MPITDAHLQQLIERGYFIIPAHLPPERCAEMSAAIRRQLKPWDEARHDPPAERYSYQMFPLREACLNRAMLDPSLIALAGRWFGTPQLVCHSVAVMVRYPGYVGDGGLDDRPWQAHQDTTNNSLLPPTADRTHAQLVCWLFPEAVDADQAPLRLIANPHRGDTSKAERVVGPAGTLAVYSTYTWHGTSSYRRGDGQRYNLNFVWGRADHTWEGVANYTNAAMDPAFKAFIGSLSAREREHFRFPPAGHPYYTRETLATLEAWYPGWDRGGEYAAALRG
ncbi:MAG: hypothetical protein NTW19_13715 [Planctomycetota bacterium]|nr:hypothetical protein [Planctomycetota bacterium]